MTSSAMVGLPSRIDTQVNMDLLVSITTPQTASMSDLTSNGIE